MLRICRIVPSLVLVCAVAFLAQTSFAQSAPTQGVLSQTSATTAEQRTAQALEAARTNPLDLRAFLVRMPKGADLHNHLSGAVYAESFIRAAAEDGLCVDPVAAAFAKPVSVTSAVPPQPVCGDGKVPAASAFKNQHLYDALVNSFSMRSFVPTPGVSGHDHFFDTFGKFGGTNVSHIGEWLDEVATRADSQNEQYMELMATPTANKLYTLMTQVKWNDDFAQYRDPFRF